MKIKTKNKKAQIGETMTLSVATLIIIFLLVIFILISSLVTANVFKKAKGESIKISAKESILVSLNAYLQTPVNVKIDNIDKEIKISDLIRLTAKNDSYKTVLKEKTKEILNPVYGDKYSISFAGEIQIDILGTLGISETNRVEMTIPAEKPITVILGVKK